MCILKDMNTLKDSVRSEVADSAIRELCKLAAYQGVTKGDIAKSIGLGRQAVSAKLNRRVRITLDEFIAMANAVGVKPGQIIAKAEGNESALADKENARS